MGIVDLVTVRQVAQLLREIYDDGCRRCAEDLQQFAGPLNDWVDELLQRTLPDNWRELLRQYLAEQEPKGYRIEPENLPPLEDWIHDWAEYRGLLPTTGGEVATQVATEQLAQSDDGGGAPSEPQVGEPESTEPDPVVRATPAAATPTESQFFDQKLAEAQERLDRTRQLLEALGNRLDAAKLDEEVEVETEVDQIEEQIWHYHDALESARDAWLRGNLSGEANTRLLGMSTPASFGLPLFTDEQQAHRAQQQELEIGRRLHERNVTMDRIHLGAVVVDWTVTGAGILLGVGILASIGKKGGRWVVVKTLAGVGAGYLADQAAEAGLRAAGASEQTIRGARLAAAVVTFILLRRARYAESTTRVSPKSTATPAVPDQPPVASLPRSTGLVPSAPFELGKWGEVRLRHVLGGRGFKPRTSLTTKLGRRFVDWIVDGVAHEAKAGVDVGLTSTIRLQALKDAELIATRRIEGAHWHFFQGAKKELLDFLTSLGIDYTVH